jgi:hypothetical protein
MSEGIWDAIDVTICPHGTFLNTGDVGSCGCQLKILTKDGGIIAAGPYKPLLMKIPIADIFTSKARRSRLLLLAANLAVLTLGDLLTIPRSTMVVRHLNVAQKGSS